MQLLSILTYSTDCMYVISHLTYGVDDLILRRVRLHPLCAADWSISLTLAETELLLPCLVGCSLHLTTPPAVLFLMTSYASPTTS